MLAAAFSVRREESRTKYDQFWSAPPVTALRRCVRQPIVRYLRKPVTRDTIQDPSSSSTE